MDRTWEVLVHIFFSPAGEENGTGNTKSHKKKQRRRR